MFLHRSTIEGNRYARPWGMSRGLPVFWAAHPDGQGMRRFARLPGCQAAKKVAAPCRL
jgi:hypothetical protein